MQNFLKFFRRNTTSTRKRNYSLPLRLEALEDRCLMSAVRTLTGFTANELAANDDGSTGAVALGFNIDYGGTVYDQLFVNNNGNVTLSNGSGTYTPYSFASSSQPIIAPFFADVDTRTGSLVTYGTDTVDGHAAFGVDWLDVGYYNQHTDNTNAFQLLLISRPDLATGAFQIEFNYDRILWETGDASGGSGGTGGTSAYVGYGSGSAGNSYQMIGSGVPGAFLDSNSSTGLVHNSLNSGSVPGRYDYLIQSSGPIRSPIPAI